MEVSKIEEVTSSEGSSSISAIITKNSADDMLSGLQKIFSVNNYKFKISNVRRNKKGEITEIKLSFDSGKTYNQILERKSNKPIDNIKIFINTDKDGNKTCGFEEVNNDVAFEESKSADGEEQVYLEIDRNNNNDSKVTEEHWSLDNMKKNGKEVVLIINGKIKDVTKKFKFSRGEELGEMTEISSEEFENKFNKKADKNKYYYEVEIVKKLNNTSTSTKPKPTIYLNDKEISKIEMDNLDSKTIKSVDVKKGKSNGEIRIVTKSINEMSDNNDYPTPPTPPTPPTFSLKTPKSLVFPKAPRTPKGNPRSGNEKEWKEFERKMEDFNKKMEAMEPQIKAFDEQMEKFNKQMEPQMKAFEEQMEIFNKKMEEYQSKMNSRLRK
jgi:hypothetical protein